ncbi:MAG TPA: tryptophan--tRNA ligase [Clostridiales bacterium]|nr:tryptophan--tRNA ligase [Clostridiales bacterium]
MRIYSAIQPTGCITIGNYIGAVKNWLALQDENECIFSIANQHALTVRQDPQEFRARTLSFFAQFLACGLDPEKSILYVQSNVPQHSELAWILSCMTYIGELDRMTQFKDKSRKNEDNINAGLFTYPVLMAADILLYRADLVPVGKDQKQHLELARDIAVRFNNRYGETFVVPEPYIPKQGAKITSLQNPLEKMSKSDKDQNATVSIIDPADAIMRKFKRAVTDSDNRIIFSEEKPGISNLLSIYSAFSGESIEAAEKRFEGKGYGDFKVAVGETVVAALDPIQKKYQEYLADKGELERIMKEGAEKAKHIAYRTLQKVKKKIGFVAD